MGSILEEIAQKIISEEEQLWKHFNSDAALAAALQNSQRRIPLQLSQQDNARGLALIAEIKRASPSQGIICNPFHPAQIARQYSDAGVAAISVLTEKHYFKGSIAHLAEVRANVALPLLRKDFIIHPYQVHEAYQRGADLVLLITALLSQERLQQLFAYVESFGMSALVEVHNEEELERALQLSPSLIGINNRDLRSFHVDLGVTRRLAKQVPEDVYLVAESGIFTAADALYVKEAGANAVLVGQGILQSSNYRDTIRQLQLNYEPSDAN